MSASGKTPNFDFPLYEVQDNFAPLTSFNQLSNKADQQLALVKSSADTAEALSSANEQDIQALETWKAGLDAVLNSFFNPTIKQINTTVPGCNGKVQASIVRAGSLLYLYSHNRFNPEEMVKIPVPNLDAAYAIASSPALAFENMKENVLYSLGVQWCYMQPKPHDPDYSEPLIRERSLALIRQNSITYLCLRLSNRDLIISEYVITGCNFMIPINIISQLPL